MVNESRSRVDSLCPAKEAGEDKSSVLDFLELKKRLGLLRLEHDLDMLFNLGIFLVLGALFRC